MATIVEKVLTHVKAHPGLNSQQIGEAIGEAPRSVSAALSYLTRQKAVGREGNPRDGYRYDVALPVGYIKSKRKRANGHGGNGRVAVGILVTLQYGKRESLTLSLEDAEQIYTQLHGIFLAANVAATKAGQ